jgi:FkbM family methyltransferase
MKNNSEIFCIKKSKSNIYDKIILYLVEKFLIDLNKKNITIYPQQILFSFEYVSTIIALYGRYEKDELDIFIHWLKTFDKSLFEGVVLDIGANIGNHSIYFAEHFDHVCSFEPQPLTFELLKLNSRNNKNIKLYNFGLSNDNYTGKFIVDKQNMGGSRLFNNDFIDLNYDYIINELKLKKLDSIQNEIICNKKVILIKIDIEGHEYEALLGSKDVIIKHNPIILFEQHVKDFPDGISKTVNLLKDFGYKKFACIERSPSPPVGLMYPFSLIYSFFYRILIGSSIKLVIKKNLTPDFYPFIIAIPNWLEKDYS